MIVYVWVTSLLYLIHQEASIIQARHSFLFRLVVVYLLVLVLPISWLCYVVYDSASRGAREELTSMLFDSGYAERLSLQNQMQSVEMQYFQFRKNKSLRNVLDSTFNRERPVMYEYIKDIGELIYDFQSYSTAIEDILIYTSNNVAASILPAFYPIEELYNKPLSDAFVRNPQLELFRRFWVLETVDGQPKLTYYAGLVDTLQQRINGVLVIRCNQSLLNPLIQIADEDISVYVCQGKKLIYSRYASPEARETIESFADNFERDNIKVLFHNDQVLRALYLDQQDITIIRAQPQKSTILLPTSFWLAIALFVLLTALLFLAIFRPIHLILLLSKHMQQSHSTRLTPYSGKVGNDEVGQLVREYNSMVVRTNGLAARIQKSNALLRSAQIQVLQSQLNPHFFYGTLENIRMIAEVNNQKLIAEIAYAFGNLMRYSLSREYFVSLQKEIELVKQYIDIQAKRFGSRFSVSWLVDTLPHTWLCPKFVLFSMVENVFTHDISRTRQRVNIAISVQGERDTLTISVGNDGPGIESDRLATIRRLIDHPEERGSFASTNNGRSIFNISDRLKLYYGDDHYFSIDSEPGVRTLCSVTIRRSLNMEFVEDA